MTADNSHVILVYRYKCSGLFGKQRESSRKKARCLLPSGLLCFELCESLLQEGVECVDACSRTPPQGGQSQAETTATTIQVIQGRGVKALATVA
jgi:hypothetical protein